MILCTFEAQPGQPALGVVDRVGGTVTDVQKLQIQLTGRANPEFSSMLALVDSGTPGLRRLRELVRQSGDWSLPLLSVRLLSPLPEPRQIRDFAGFAQHIEQGLRGAAILAARLANEPVSNEVPVMAPVFRQVPLHYFSNRFNVVGHDAVVEWPPYCEYLDFELELAVCLGKSGKNIPAQSAAEYIFGYTIFNDVSGRDVQAMQMPAGLGPCKGKSFDTGNVIGPWIVTPDEIPNVQDLKVSVKVNGEIWSETTTRGMTHTFPQMIAFASQSETVHAGEVFASGTVGSCSGLELEKWIKDGDVVELEVEKIGTLRNKYRRAH